MDESSRTEIPEGLACRLRSLSSGLLSDALDRAGIAGVVTGILPLAAGASRAAGIVVTVGLGPPGPDSPARHLGSAAIAAADGNSVIVVAGAARADAASWGGLLSRAARCRGIDGVVVDGSCRDVDEIRALGLPVFARGATPVTARGRVVERATNTSVQVSGVRVEPGDLVLADESGVVFIPRVRAAEILGVAEELGRREEELARELDSGRSPVDVLNDRYEGLIDDDL